MTSTACSSTTLPPALCCQSQKCVGQPCVSRQERRIEKRWTMLISAPWLCSELGCSNHSPPLLLGPCDIPQIPTQNWLGIHSWMQHKKLALNFSLPSYPTMLLPTSLAPPHPRLCPSSLTTPYTTTPSCAFPCCFPVLNSRSVVYTAKHHLEMIIKCTNKNNLHCMTHGLVHMCQYYKEVFLCCFFRFEGFFSPSLESAREKGKTKTTQIQMRF